VGYDLLVALEDVAGALVGCEFLRVEVDLAGVSFVAAAYDCVHVSVDIEGAESGVRGAVGHDAVAEEVVEAFLGWILTF